ncbi:hypothetical protein AB0K12_35415 [Nonomuraea sp. NPDC049419]|uniref:hypothetical protein n=1 Tax=Nonomuraea sp. NPDC049419 TaxID=3155772 RepID=UPI0034330484
MRRYAWVRRTRRAAVAMGRALLKEPGLVGRIRQDPAATSTCIHCNRCMPTIYRGTHCPIAQAGS